MISLFHLSFRSDNVPLSRNQETFTVANKENIGGAVIKKVQVLSEQCRRRVRARNGEVYEDGQWVKRDRYEGDGRSKKTLDNMISHVVIHLSSADPAKTLCWGFVSDSALQCFVAEFASFSAFPHIVMTRYFAYKERFVEKANWNPILKDNKPFGGYSPWEKAVSFGCSWCPGDVRWPL